MTLQADGESNSSFAAEAIKTPTTASSQSRNSLVLKNSLVSGVCTYRSAISAGSPSRRSPAEEPRGLPPESEYRLVLINPPRIKVGRGKAGHKADFGLTLRDLKSFRGATLGGNELNAFVRLGKWQKFGVDQTVA